MCNICQALSLNSVWNGIHDDDATSTGFASTATSGATTVSSEAAGAYLQGATGNQNIDGLLSGFKWTTTALKWRIPTAASDYDTNPNTAGIQYGDMDRVNGFLAPTAAMDTATTEIFTTMFGGVSGLTFTKTTASETSADLTIGRSTTVVGDFETAYAYYPTGSGTGLSGDSWYSDNYDISGAGYALNNPVKGGYAWNTYIHEYGHNMGLKHGHETTGGVSGAMAADRDGMEFSVMTYRSYVGGPTNGYTNERWGFAQTLMMYDIAALQVMYGANFTTNNGNSVYTFSSTTGQMFINGVGQGAPGGNRIFLTIWDGGGIDTYDFSNYTTNQSIDLTPGSWSLMSNTQQANLGGGNFARGNVYNALQYNGDVRSLIENATGGSGNDTITGNAASNTIAGGLGADTIFGGDGNDTIYGGRAGTDAMDGNDTIHGGAGNDVLHGNAGKDVAFGGIGADTIYGGVGDDILVGGTAYTDPQDTNDFIYAQDGNDAIHGNAGDDLVEAGSGTDTIYGGIGNDVIYGQTSTIQSEISSNLLFGQDGNDILVGAAGNDTLQGDGGNDRIDGAYGNDLLSGGNGADTFVFLKEDFGRDAITDFDPAAGDRIELSKSICADFSQLLQFVATNGADTLITFSTLEIIELRGVSLAQIQASNFHFV